MGNQASRAIDRSRRKDRRRSTATLGAQSHTSQGNYNWIEENQATDLSAGALHAAMAAAAATKPPPVPQAQAPRRKSITELFTIRKLSFTRPSEEDFREYDRLQRQHYLLKSARKSNAWAPIKSPSVVVDVGTGNGIWALEMASQHPQAKVIGIDVRPPPEQTVGAPNLKYIRADIHDPWPVSDQVADFIFQRNMASEIRKEQWPTLLAEMYRVLKPGGYIELFEADPCFHNPGPVQQAFDGFRRGQWTDANLDFEFADAMEGYLEESGFTQIEKRTLDIPIGEWPEEPELKQFGFINKETQKLYLRNRKQELVTKWNIPVADYDTAVQEILEEFEEQRSFSRFYCWIARKPEQPAV